MTGIDLAEGMVRAVSEEAALRGVRAQLHVMDAEQLDFPDATFDRVLWASASCFSRNSTGH